MNAEQFLDYITKSKAKSTAKNYRNGIRHFCRWYKNDFNNIILNEVLEERKTSLENEDPQQRKKFELLIEEWHRSQLNNGASVNSARNRYVSLCQFFKFFDLDLKTSIIPSEVKKTVISERYYPLTIEELRAMYHVAALRGRAILLMAKDLGLRISDFRMITVEQLPNLDAETPIPFNMETRKKHVWTKGFLSAETVQILKTYLKTLKNRKKPSPFLWPSNGSHPLDEDSFGVWLKKLAEKAGIKTGNQRLTFHCFRRLLMRAAIETGVGLTAAKLMVGKAVAKSDETYIARAQLQNAFKKLSKFLNVTGVEPPSQPELTKTVVNQQREITDLKDTIKDLTGRLDLITKDFSRSAASQLNGFTKKMNAQDLSIQELKMKNEELRTRLQILEDAEKERRRFLGLDKPTTPEIRSAEEALRQAFEKLKEDVKRHPERYPWSKADKSQH